MKKNDILTLTITDQSATGEGIGKSEGFPFFVKDAIIGDTIKAGITKWKKTYGYARLISIVEPSPFRVEPRCAHARRCGGCQIQAMDYARQLKYKEDAVANALMRIGHMSEEEVKACMRPIVGMDEPWRYRNKSQYPIGRGEDGEPIAGYYAARSHRIVPHTECAIGHESDKYFLDCILTWMKECDIPAYDEESGEGIVRHAVLRHGYRSGEQTQRHMRCGADGDFRRRGNRGREEGSRRRADGIG